MDKGNNPTSETQKTEQPSGNPAKNEVVSETKNSNNKALVIVLIVVGILVLLGVGGTILAGTLFKKAGESIVENATGTKITTSSDGTTTVESKDGSSSYTASAEQKLPTDFPTNIPLYPDQKITGSYKQKTASGNYWQVTSETSDAVSKVVSNVKEAYSKAPWTSEGEVESDGSFSLSYAKTGYRVSVFISKSSDMAMTSLTYTVTQETETATE